MIFRCSSRPTGSLHIGISSGHHMVTGIITDNLRPGLDTPKFQVNGNERHNLWRPCRNLECGGPAPLACPVVDPERSRREPVEGGLSPSDGLAVVVRCSRSLGYWTFLVVLLDIEPYPLDIEPLRQPAVPFTLDKRSLRCHNKYSSKGIIADIWNIRFAVNAPKGSIKCYTFASYSLHYSL